MSVASAKAQVAMANLASVLKQRLPTLAQTAAFDTDLCPTLLVGDGVANHENFFIKICPVAAAWAQDVLGNAQVVFSPLKIQIVTEHVSTGGTERVPLADRLQVWGLAASSGYKVEIWESAADAAPTVTTLGTASNQKGSFEIEDKYRGMPGMGQ